MDVAMYEKDLYTIISRAFNKPTHTSHTHLLVFRVLSGLVISAMHKK